METRGVTSGCGDKDATEEQKVLMQLLSDDEDAGTLQSDGESGK